MIKESGYTSVFIAKRLGYSKQTICVTINGHYKGVEVVKKLQNFLQVNKTV